MGPFKAYRIEETEARIQGSFVMLDETELDDGDVTIRVEYSSINYKDALAATGAGRIIRRFPCVGGVDLAGIVEHSHDPRFRPGDAVVATGFDIGVGHHGGYAQFARLPGDWVSLLPDRLSTFEAMAIGTAGFTAALAILRLQSNGLRPDQGPVIVTGASGGVGSMAISMLARTGYSVAALTGKASESDYLLQLGASEVIDRTTLDLSTIRPLGKMRWAGAIDNLGGSPLAWLASTMKQYGRIASIGLAAGTAVNTTVMPFILRGVSLLGIDSVNIAPAERHEIWNRLADDLRPDNLPLMIRCIDFDALPGAFSAFIDGKVRGRIVVDIAGRGIPPAFAS